MTPAPPAPLPPDARLTDGGVDVWVVGLDAPDKARRRELAHRAQDLLLAAYLRSAPDRLNFERGPGGKPRLRGEPLQFNLSHSGRLGLVAVSGELPVGADVQAPHSSLAKPWFAERVCSPREYAYFGGAPTPDQLLRLWVRKEAVIKARGEGSAFTVRDVDVLEDEIDGGWRCVDVRLDADAPAYRAAVALPDRADAPVRVRRFVWRS